jgi:hypothetical protein
MATLNHKIENLELFVQVAATTNQLANEVKEDAKQAFEEYKTVLIVTSIFQAGAIVTLAGSIVYAANKLSK